MQTLSENFLTIAEQQRITKAVQSAERITSGEIVPMIVSQSHAYPMAAAICAFSFALPTALLLTHFAGGLLWIGSQNIWFFLVSSFLLYFALYTLAMKRSQLKYFFLQENQVEQEVRKGALAAFFSERLYKTRDNNGILIYVSVLEKRVWVLADSGINEKIDQKEWDSVVEKLTAGIKNGQSCDALCTAVLQVGQILQSNFPYKRDDTDELHNLIIR